MWLEKHQRQGHAVLSRLFNRKKRVPMLGLDISSSSVKLLELSRDGHRHLVEGYARVALPPQAVVESNIAELEAVGAALAEAHRRSRCRLRTAAVAVAASAVMPPLVAMPAGLPCESKDALMSMEA